MNLVARALLLGSLILALVGILSVAAAKTILIIGPQPADEALIAAGRVRAAVLSQDRGGELLGLTEQDVIFLGYSDGSMMNIYGRGNECDIQRRYQRHRYLDPGHHLNRLVFERAPSER